MSQPDIVRALSNSWCWINANTFGGALRTAPTFEIKQMVNRAACWNASERAIRFSEKWVALHPWNSILEVLKHEMAHQYVSDVLGVEDETSHGPAFRMVCDRYGISESGAIYKPSEEEHRIIEKARKLLALGESPNRNEAEAALAAVQRLLGQHGLAEECIRERNAEGLSAVFVGPIVSRKELYHQAAASILMRHFRVRGIWIPTRDPRSSASGMQLELVGRHNDLALAEYVHDWLHDTAKRLCPTTLKAKERLDFLGGVMVGYLKRLDAERDAAPKQTTALVTTGDASNVDRYFERRHPKTKKTRARVRKLTASFGDGMSIGAQLSMEKPIADSSSGPKLLGPGGR